MAYMNLLASVREAEVERSRNEPSFLARPSMVSGVSHLLSYWVEAQPLGGLLKRALDGGGVIHPALWHPLRPPLYHGPDAVRELDVAIVAAWDEAVRGATLPDEEWLAVEMSRLLRVFRHAAESGECVISALDRPADDERARRVRLPWAPR